MAHHATLAIHHTTTLSQDLKHDRRIDSNNAVPPILSQSSPSPQATYKNLKPWDDSAMPASARLALLDLKPPQTSARPRNSLVDSKGKAPLGENPDLEADNDLTNESMDFDEFVSKDSEGVIRVRPFTMMSLKAEKVDSESDDKVGDCKPCCIPGPPGKPGPNGKNGVPGNPGHNGLPGKSGNPPKRPCQEHTSQLCKECPQGPDGPPGPRGEPGTPGSSGHPGSRGLNGLPGIPGGRGVRGLPGLPGLPGAEGNFGEIPVAEPAIPGEPGLPGPPGPRGPIGKPGKPATPSADGLKGPRGSPGADGVPGLQGEPGFPGPAGLPGAAGMCSFYCGVDRGIFFDQGRTERSNSYRRQ
ncbi:collagen triple helix repeat protein [Cooperia oncophora]